ncbi:hypothetical protein FRZ06_02715 [Anoxybacterium hadale]|uniref:Uncharacterized protein n=1 Tax=Anoxybacterium hadale TaxID=3408580 RepID=A0ACD1A7K7_9FIRM|nr:hypothetical protein FRZ06_02715 [Clostridiales bacterium]
MLGFKEKLVRKIRTGADTATTEVIDADNPKRYADDSIRYTDDSKRYTEAVCSQIRHQKVRCYIARELEDHIEDRKIRLIKAGIPEQEALQSAISDMGDAIEVGQELDRVHRPKPEWSIIAVTAIMLCIGVCVQYYLSRIAAEGSWAGREAFHKYMTTLPVGIVFLLAAYFADYTVLGKYPKRIYTAILLLCVALHLYDGQIFSLYRHNLNARYQMVYLALLLLPAYGAILYSDRNRGYDGILRCGAAAVAAILVLGYSQQEYVLVIFAVGGLILISAAIAKGWFAVEKKKALALVYVPTLLSMFGFFLLKLWRYGEGKNLFLEMIKGKILISQDTPDGFLVLFARSIIKNAKWIGQGELSPMVKSHTTRLEELLPIWWGDFSLTYLIHQWGIVTGILTLAIFTFLIIKMIRVTLKQRNALGFIISLSVVTAIGMQSLLFLSANLGICLLVILPLPLMTIGQTSFLVNMVLLGLLLSAHRNLDIIMDLQTVDRF